MNTCFSPLELSSAAGGGCGPRSLCLEFAQPGRLRSTIIMFEVCAAGGGGGPRAICLEFAQPRGGCGPLIVMFGVCTAESGCATHLFLDKMGRLFLDKWAKIWQSEFASGSGYRASSRASFHKPG